jgi:hypothetical protein
MPIEKSINSIIISKTYKYAELIEEGQAIGFGLQVISNIQKVNFTCVNIVYI